MALLFLHSNVEPFKREGEKETESQRDRDKICLILDGD